MLALDVDVYRRELDEILAGGPGAAQRKADVIGGGIIGQIDAFNASVEDTRVAVERSGIIGTFATSLAIAARGLHELADTSPGLLKWGTVAVVAAAAAVPLGFAFTGLAAAAALATSPVVLIGTALAGLIALNWRPLMNGLASFSAFFRRGLSPSIAARLGRVRAGLAGMVAGLGSGSGIRFNGMAAKMGSALAALANGANAAAPGVARFARSSPVTRSRP